MVAASNLMLKTAAALKRRDWTTRLQNAGKNEEIKEEIKDDERQTYHILPPHIRQQQFLLAVSQSAQTEEGLQHIEDSNSSSSSSSSSSMRTTTMSRPCRQRQWQLRQWQLQQCRHRQWQMHQPQMTVAKCLVAPRQGFIPCGHAGVTTARYELLIYSSGMSCLPCDIPTSEFTLNNTTFFKILSINVATRNIHNYNLEFNKHIFVFLLH